MSQSWAFWYPSEMGCQERLWCAVRADDVDEAFRSLRQGASATLPGPQGSAQEMANAHQSARILAAMGWGTYAPEHDEPISLEDLDFAIEQVDTLKRGLDLEMPEDDFLELLPFLGNAQLVEENPYAWRAPEGVSDAQARELFRLTHTHGAVIAMPSIHATPVLLLSPQGARKWAPRLAAESMAGDQKNVLN